MCPVEDGTVDTFEDGGNDEDSDGDEDNALIDPSMLSNADEMLMLDDDDETNAEAGTIEVAVVGTVCSLNEFMAASTRRTDLDTSSLPGDGRSTGALLFTASTGLKLRPILPESDTTEGDPNDDVDVTGPAIDEDGRLSKSRSCPTSIVVATPAAAVAALPMPGPKGTSMSKSDAVEVGGTAFRKSIAVAAVVIVIDGWCNGPVANARSSKLVLVSALGGYCCCMCVGMGMGIGAGAGVGKPGAIIPTMPPGLGISTST